MVELLLLPIKHKDTRRICKRIIRYNQELFTFLDNPLLRQPIIALERQLRPKVIMRKITFGNRSALGALNQAVMMSIRETSILNGIEKAEAKPRHHNNPIISIVKFLEKLTYYAEAIFSLLSGSMIPLCSFNSSLMISI